MILMCHQPNFLPYLGYFYKLYKCDIYSASNTCYFTNDKNNGMHNYNYILNNGVRQKFTIPVDRHHGPICDVLIDKNYNPEYMLKQLRKYYQKAPHLEEVMNDISKIMLSFKGGDKLYKLNIALTDMIIKKMGMAKPIFYESDYKELPDDPTKAIIFMCKELKCSHYISGIGGHWYMNEQEIADNGIELVYSDFDETKDLTHNKLSILDYLMNYGYVIPKEWK